MKSTFLKTVFISSIILISSAKAQIKKPGITLGGNLIYSSPQGHFKETYNDGFGGEIFGGVGLGSTFIIGTIGIAYYKGKAESKQAMTIKPIKVGVKKYFLLKKVFFNGDVGVASINMSGINSSAFTAGFGGGVRLLGLEAGLYENTLNNKESGGFLNTLQFKIGYSLSL